MQLRREDEFHKNYLPRLGIETFYPFKKKPQVGDTFYLGFDLERDISGHILQLAFECDPTQAVGIRREDPPLVWECSLGNGQWQELRPSTRTGEKDTTGGLNNPQGRLTFYLPLDMQPDQHHGRDAYWLRCRIEPRRPEQGMYTESPRVKGLTAYALGAAVPATHATIVENEILGRSNGEPSQVFALTHAPVLALREEEWVEVQEERYGELVFTPWHPVHDFAHSDRYDRHFTLDTASGEVALGPAVRQPDGTVRQYGRVPESGRMIRFSRYRHGGGVPGNLPPDSLTGLTTSLAYVSRVSNLRRASGGRDPENMEEVVIRAQREMRAQLRAVTAEDYEHLTLQASRAVARVKCNTPRSSNSQVPPGTVEILVVPDVTEALQAGDLSALHLDTGLTTSLEDYLDEFRLLTTILRIREPNYVGLKVQAEIVPSEFSQPEAVRTRAIEALETLLCPLSIVQDREKVDDIMGREWQGWPFGRDLYLAEIFSLLQRLPGVQHVLDVRISRRQVIPATEVGRDAADSETAVVRQRLVAVDKNVVRVPANTLLCSLEHEIKLVELEADDD
jgi:predicted phage baseplate assembly protein